MCGQFTKNYSIFYQKNWGSQKYGFGIRALEKTYSGSDPIDPGSGAKKAPYPGSANTDGSYCLNMEKGWVLRELFSLSLLRVL